MSLWSNFVTHMLPPQDAGVDDELFNTGDCPAVRGFSFEAGHFVSKLIRAAHLIDHAALDRGEVVLLEAGSTSRCCDLPVKIGERESDEDIFEFIGSLRQHPKFLAALLSFARAQTNVEVAP